jgi:hypothetical protein
MKHRPLLGRKGYEISDLGPFAMAFVVIAVVLAMGSLIVTEVSEETWESTAVTFETHNISAASGLQNVTLTNVENGIVSGSYTLTLEDSVEGQQTFTASTNYSVTLSTGVVNITSCPICNDTADVVNASYSYNADTAATNVTDAGIDAFDEFSGWFDILVIIVVAALIIGVLIYFFSGKGSAGI